MRVLPYFNNIQLPARNERPAEVKSSDASASRDTAGKPAGNVSAGEAPGTDVFIPSSPVSGVVYSYKSVAGNPDTPETVIKSGDYSFYQLNGSKQQREMGNVGGKLDLKG